MNMGAVTGGILYHIIELQSFSYAIAKRSKRFLPHAQKYTITAHKHHPSHPFTLFNITYNKYIYAKCKDTTEMYNNANSTPERRYAPLY